MTTFVSEYIVYKQRLNNSAGSMLSSTLLDAKL